MGLLLNHADAWGLTLIIGSVCLLLHDAFSLPHLGLILTLAGTAWFAFALNDYFDAPFDAHDPLKGARNYFAGHPASPVILLSSVVILVVILLVLGTFGGRGLIVFGVAFTAAWAYSAPPLRLKRRPGYDLITHALFVQTAPYAITLILIGAAWQTFDVLLVVLLALSSLGAQLEQQIRDYELDRRLERNFTTLIGQRWASRLLRLVTVGFTLIGIGGAVGGYFPPKLLPFALIGAPLIAHRFLRRADAPRSERLAFGAVIAALLYTGSLWGAALIR